LAEGRRSEQHQDGCDRASPRRHLISPVASWDCRQRRRFA
jgi:hypothetical protein